MKKSLFAAALLSGALAMADSSLTPASQGTPVIDGKLNDAIWQNSIAATPFSLTRSNAFAKQQTLARFAWDDENFYASFLCRAEVLDPVNNKLHALKRSYKGHDQKNAIYKDDMIEILLNNPAAPRIFDIAVSASGALNDCTVPKRGDMWSSRDFAWESGAKVAVDVNIEKNNGFWAVELSIPWKNLGGKPAANAQWEIVAARFEKDSRESSSFQVVNTGIHSRASFGKIKFFKKTPGVTLTAMPEMAPGENTLKASVSGTIPVELVSKVTFDKNMQRNRQRSRGGDAALKFPLNSSGSFQFSWSINGSANFTEYFRSPVYDLMARSSKLAGTAKGGKLFINKSLANKGAVLQSGLNTLTFQATGTPELKFACDQWQLPFPANWKENKSKKEYTLNLLSEYTTIWPNWHDEGLHVNPGGLQQLQFAPTGFPGMRVSDYTINLDLPQGMKLIHASGYYNIYPSITVSKPVTVMYGKKKFNRYSITINQNLKYRKPEKLGSHEWLACLVSIDKNIAKEGNFIAYHASSSQNAVIEIPNKFKVNVIQPVNGRQPKNYRVQLWAGWLKSMKDKSAYPEYAKFFASAGITEDNSTFNEFVLINFKSWNFDCRPYLKAHPGTAQIDARGKAHSEYVCTTELLTPSFEEYFNKNIAAWYKRMGEPQHIDWDFESPVFAGALTCCCQRCLKAFAEEAKLSAVPANIQEVQKKYAPQWVTFMNRRFAKMVELKAKAIKKNLKPGTVFSVYTGYQSEHTRSFYGVDWSMLDGKIDYAMAGYGRNPADLLATQKALPNTKMILGELYTPYRTTLKNKPSFSTPSNLMRRACDADGGILLYELKTLDGRTFYALGEVTRAVAENEEFFTSDIRRTEMLNIRGYGKSEYEVLSNGKGDYLLVILNQTSGSRKVNAKFDLPKGKKLVDLKSGKVVDAAFTTTLKGGEFALYKTR